MPGQKYGFEALSFSLITDWPRTAVCSKFTKTCTQLILTSYAIRPACTLQDATPISKRLGQSSTPPNTRFLGAVDSFTTTLGEDCGVDMPPTSSTRWIIVANGALHFRKFQVAPHNSAGADKEWTAGIRPVDIHRQPYTEADSTHAQATEDSRSDTLTRAKPTLEVGNYTICRQVNINTTRKRHVMSTEDCAC